jgi:hypothetical protein
VSSHAQVTFDEVVDHGLWGRGCTKSAAPASVGGVESGLVRDVDAGRARHRGEQLRLGFGQPTAVMASR